MNSEPQAPAPSGACRILSLDGGGAKGFYTLGVLKEIEALGRPLIRLRLGFRHQYGRNHRCTLGLGSPVDEIHRLYKEHVPMVMSGEHRAESRMPWSTRISEYSDSRSSPM